MPVNPIKQAARPANGDVTGTCVATLDQTRRWHRNRPASRIEQQCLMDLVSVSRPLHPAQPAGGADVGGAMTSTAQSDVCRSQCRAEIFVGSIGERGTAW
jgi:hypothetical protein